MSGAARMSSIRNWIRILAGLAAIGLLAACSSAPTKQASRSAPSGHPELPWSGGKYYQDDGPGAHVPHDIDQISDAVPRDEPIHRATTRPYSVFGVRYTPMTSRTPFVQEGRASWYGRKFHGALTANGETYDMYAMSGAHKTLPLPSYVRVTNLANGRQVVVRVNDRGPFHSGRIIDLSYAAAYKLGYLSQGSTRVRIELVQPGDEPPVPSPVPATPEPVRVEASPPPRQPVATTVAVTDAPAPAATAMMSTEAPVPAAVDPGDILDGKDLPAFDAATGASATPASGIYLQLGAFQTRDNAEGFLDYVGRNLNWLRGQLDVMADADHFRLNAGPYPSAEAARDVARRISEALNLQPFVVTR